MSEEFKRTTPEEALETYSEQKRGHLKIFIGYAPGVGKTYSMLNEAHRRTQRGQDAVIGYIETHHRQETEAMIGDLEIIPRKNFEYNGIAMEEMDTDAVIARKPAIVLVDELAHTNLPGSKYEKRYEDVEKILSNGINVLTTLNIQHLESLNDVIRQITGIKVRETIPDRIVDNADDVVVIDVTPDALRNRLKRGIIYSADKVEQSLKNFFRKGNLTALRELALRQTAEEVDEELEEYMKEHGIKDNWHTVERVMVCISPNPSAKKLIRRGARISRRYKCEWIVVNINSNRLFAPKLNEKYNERILSHFKLAEQLGAEVITLTGKSISKTLSNLASQRHITQIIIGHTSRSIWQTFLRGSTVTKLLRHNKTVEVHVIPNDK